MESQNRFSEELREIADRMEVNDNYIIKYLHDHFLRPLQECRILSKNEVAEMLKVSASYVSKLTKNGVLKTTADGRVTEFHLREYLTNSPDQT
jgi:excisionase family DNA binding protein